MAYIIGVDDVSKKVKDVAVGVDGIATFVKRGYIGVDGVARKFYDRASYQKRLYFFPTGRTSGVKNITNKLYSVTEFGTDPIEYTFDDEIIVSIVDTTDTWDNPTYATWPYVNNAKMFYDPKTHRLCICAFRITPNTTSSCSSMVFYTIDCNKNTIIDKKIVDFSNTSSAVILVYYDTFTFKYSHEMGCVFVVWTDTLDNSYYKFNCYDIRNLTIKTCSTAGSYYALPGFVVTPTSTGCRLACIERLISITSTAYHNIYDWNFNNNTITVSAPSTPLPTTSRGCCFIWPHSYYNKNIMPNPFGLCFLGAGTSGKSDTGYIITKDGYAGSTISITSSLMTARKFGMSNTHGFMWVQGNNGVTLAKYLTSYAETNNPTGGMANNSGRTFEGPVIGGGIITGYSDANNAVIYANVSGSYYNITPQVFGPYNTPICDGINLKEVLIPNSNQFLVYDFNQAAYTTPISVAGVMSQYNITPCPYVALLSWTEEEQNALVNLGY